VSDEPGHIARPDRPAESGGARGDEPARMAQNVRELRCSVDDLFRVLADGWLYPVWVVGASRIREVEADWPRAGSRLHHSVGVWPVLIDDTTVMTEWVPGVRMRARARGWPIGEAVVVIEAQPRGEDRCVVRIFEEAATGPARLIPKFLRVVMLNFRNRETLRRLAYLAEGGARSA
jgi:hypothetical protein